MIRIIVASKNPVKIQTTESAFKKMFPNETFSIEGISAQSNVSAQPMTEQETLTGAINRAQNAKLSSASADYWVGIEGGVKETDQHMEAFAWIVIINSSGKLGQGRTGSFFLPQRVAELVRQGKELGEADDIVFNKTNSKQANGAVGLLTGDVITRASYYEPAVIMALIPFKNPDLY